MGHRQAPTDRLIALLIRRTDCRIDLLLVHSRNDPIPEYQNALAFTGRHIQALIQPRRPDQMSYTNLSIALL